MDLNINTCSRCGKIRKVVRTWKEKIQTYNGLTEIVCTQAVCPDKEFQKKVDAELEVKRLKSEEMARNKEKIANGKKKVGIKISSARA